MSNKEKKKGNPKFFKIYGMQSANFQDSGSYDKRRAQLSKKKIRGTQKFFCTLHQRKGRKMEWWKTNMVVWTLVTPFCLVMPISFHEMWKSIWMKGQNTHQFTSLHEPISLLRPCCARRHQGFLKATPSVRSRGKKCPIWCHGWRMLGEIIKVDLLVQLKSFFSLWWFETKLGNLAGVNWN